jgi:hypothetical protein
MNIMANAMKRGIQTTSRCDPAGQLKAARELHLTGSTEPWGQK